MTKLGRQIAAHLQPRELRAIVALGLTRRQQAVLERVHAGLPDKLIADALHMSQQTVRSHLKATFIKLRVVNRTLAALIWERALVSPGMGSPKQHLPEQRKRA